MSHEKPRRSVARAVEVPGSPEEVWALIATGPGISTWFVPTELDEREGGDAVFHMGADLDAPATVTAFDAPRRLAYEEAWEQDTLATEFLVEARAGGTCVVRVVSTFSGDGHDKDLDAMGSGWDSALDVLRLVLTHFRGQPATPLAAATISERSKEEAWTRLTGALGVDGAAVGARVEASAGPSAALAGVLERRTADELLILTDTPAPGLAGFSVFTWDETTRAGVRGTFFGTGAREAAAREQEAWQAWLDEHLAPAG